MSRTWNTRIEQNIHLPLKSYSPWSLGPPLDSTDYTVDRNIRISLDKRIAFSKQSYGDSKEKRMKANMARD